MKLIRFQDASGHICYGEQVDDHLARVISGNIFGDYMVTDDVVPVCKLLASVEPRTILAGDIGGTKALLALFEEKNGSFNQVEEATYASREYTGLNEILKDFLSQTNVKVERTCLGVPGPVVNRKCQTTHHQWLIDVNEIKSQLEIKEVFFFFYMVALAYAIPFLADNQFEVLQNGKPEKANKIGLIAAGTGLGQAFLLIPDRGEPVVLSSEGGHCDFALQGRSRRLN